MFLNQYGHYYNDEQRWQKMGFIEGLLKALGFGQKKQEKLLEKAVVSEPKRGFEVRSVWDFLQFNEHTQAFHLASVIRFDEWAAMDEIRSRIFELFQVDYENERSLYPYLKTMVDIGLIETNSIGGKRKWRKKDLLIKIEKETKEEQKEAILAEETEKQA